MKNKTKTKKQKGQVSMSTAAKIKGIIVLVGLGFLALMSGQLVENLDARNIIVIQRLLTGNLTWHTTPGPKMQMFGKVTRYPKQDQFWFEEKAEHSQEGNRPLRIRFNDGAHATISGSISWEMPLDTEHLTTLHSKYGSVEAIELQLIRTIVEKSVYMTGPLMSSAESYAAKRNELLSYIEDQVMLGVYKTDVRTERTKDTLTGQEKTVQIVEIARDKNGVYAREVASPLSDFKIRAYNLSINEVKYEGDVEAQIAGQQKAIMEVQTAIAKAKTAEQNTITTEQEGKANAAKAKWEQEVLKARAVTEAQQKVEVSALDALALKTNAVIKAQQEVEVAEFGLKAAESKKATDIALGEGEAKRRQLVMEADGALEKKLSAWVEVNKTYAEAIKGYQGQWVPNVVLGGGSSNGGGGAMDLVQLLTAKTAMDLGLELKTLPRAVPTAARK